jgi:hypothetical protein
MTGPSFDGTLMFSPDQEEGVAHPQRENYEEFEPSGTAVEPRIEVVEACGEWFVRVVGDDQQVCRQFELESIALAYAEGQRRRLKLAAIVRL